MSAKNFDLDVDEALQQALAIADLLASARDPNPETVTEAGCMLYTRLLGIAAARERESEAEETARPKRAAVTPIRKAAPADDEPEHAA